MNLVVENTLKSKLGYINAIDVLQGIGISIMVTGHILLWWDYDTYFALTDPFFIAYTYFAAFGGQIFFFLMGFNMRNSIARRLGKGVPFPEIRIHLLKRGFIFLLIGTLNPLSVALFSGATGATLYSLLLSWDLFHMFGVTVLGIYIIYEILHQLNSRNLLNGMIDRQIIVVCSGLLIFILMMTIFLQALYSSDFSFNVFYPTRTIKALGYGHITNVAEAIQVATARGGFSIFPYLSFGVLGFLLASLRLHLPTEQSWRKILAVIAVIFGAIGSSLVLFLQIPVVFPLYAYHMSSLSYIFLYWAVNITVFLILLIFFDVKRKREIFPYVEPLARLGKLALTIYYLEYVSPLLLSFFNIVIPNLLILLLLIGLYLILFMMIAYAWEKFLNYKYSLEWILRKLTN